MIVPLLLSGGVGSRLWPVSRKLHPKQFLPLLNEGSSLIQDTALRVASVAGNTPGIVVCNEEHRFMVAEQLRQVGIDAAIILEPEGRNTAPAIALGALQALEMDPEALLLVLPADHIIADEQALARAVSAGSRVAAEGSLVTFGIVPDKPETGYGYIRRGPAIEDDMYAIAEFVEKPALEQAKAYLASGDYCWNSGMFLLNARQYLAELERFAPQIASACRAAFAGASQDLDFIRVDADAFRASPSDSIDYAVMEKTDAGVMVALDCGWSDIGSWSTLWDIQAKDAAGNVTKGDVLLDGVSNSYLHSDSRLIAAIGVEDLVVVETADAILIADRHGVQDVKNLVRLLEQDERSEVNIHTQVYRPWGSYESLVEDVRFQVKRIIVNPGERLSLQMHHHRAEHWIVVKGTARVTCDDQEFIITEDQSTYIPLGRRHRLENPGVVPLELIEVQTGAYLGEDDIVRFEDVYGRDQ